MTAKELRTALSISQPLWNYWRYQRKAKNYPFPTPEGSKKGDRYNPIIAAWDYDKFKEWWEGRPDVGRPSGSYKDITDV